MKTILQELQNYIAKLLAVWMAQQLVGLVGGMFGGSDASLGITKGADGVREFKFAEGGLVQHFANGSLVKSLKDLGGYVPMDIGTPGQDSVPTMLMPGEVVIRKSMVDYYGKDFLLQLNAGKIEKLASGGVVGGGGTSTPTNGSGSGELTAHIVINNIADGRSVPQPSAQDIINVVSFSANSRSEIYKVIKTVVAN